jgi:hypothetical protein
MVPARLMVVVPADGASPAARPEEAHWAEAPLGAPPRRPW